MRPEQGWGPVDGMQAMRQEARGSALTDAGGRGRVRGETGTQNAGL